MLKVALKDVIWDFPCVLLFFFPSFFPTEKIIIIVKQGRQHFFLLLKRTHVIVIFYLLSLKSVPQRRPRSLHQTSKSRMVLIKLSAPLRAASLDTLALIFSFHIGKSLTLHFQKKKKSGHGPWCIRRGTSDGPDALIHKTKPQCVSKMYLHHIRNGWPSSTSTVSTNLKF